MGGIRRRTYRRKKFICWYIGIRSSKYDHAGFRHIRSRAHTAEDILVAVWYRGIGNRE